MLIGVTFLAEAATGILIAVALAIEILFLGVAGVIALPSGMRALKKLVVPAGFEILPLTGVIGGVLVLDGVTG